MSIIERALQKAQQRAKSVPPAPDAVTGHPETGVPDTGSSAPAQPAPAIAGEPAAHGPSGHAAAESLYTSLDLKRIVDLDFERLREAGRLPPAHAVR